MKNNNLFSFLGMIWTAIFAGMSFYWAMGGLLGAKTLGGAIYEKSLNPDEAFITILWITGFIKLLGIVLLFTVRINWKKDWIKVILFYITKIVGVMFFLYGLLNFTTILLNAAGILNFDLSFYATLWRLAFWEPFWMLGGVFYFLSMTRR